MKCIITTATNDLNNSLDFYKTLGFQSMIVGSGAVALSKGVSILIDSGRYARCGIRIYDKNWAEKVEPLKKTTHLTKTNDGYVLSDGNGVWIYLDLVDNVNWFENTNEANSVLGNFAGLSIETTDVERTLGLYNLLGFQLTAGAIEQGWLSLADSNGFNISVMKPNMCPHLFFNPSMTFFNGKDNPAIIEKIRALGIPIAEEITHFNKSGEVDNIIIRDPGGYGFFIFND